MKPNFEKTVTNWGNFPIVKKEIRAEEDYDKIREFLKTHNEVIARGNGRCYGDASLADAIFSTQKLNKFIGFDRINGILECEAGVLLSDILEVIVPQGYFLAITPGTKLISLGGAIASNVHGKNHHKKGNFSECVLEFSIMDENGMIITCSREKNTEKFWSTLGGMGLTGIILSAKIKLQAIETAYIRQESIKAQNIDEIFQLFEESEDWTYTVAWIDCLQKNKNIGRSILMRGEFALKTELPPVLQKNPLRLKKKWSPTIPFYFPSFVLNTFSVKAFNFLYFNKQTKKVLKNFVNYETFFYPLDSINHWNKIYGKGGFIQYQMVIPKDKGKEGMKTILETIARSGQGSFLAVLKLFGKGNVEAYNSFPFEGYTLALDFKVNRQLTQLVSNLDKIVEQYGGRIYRTKDSMSKSSLTSYLQHTDNPKFVSLQSKRIARGL